MPAGRRKAKGNMDIESAIDAMEMSESLDHLVIFSGDGDFRSLVEALQHKGKRVSVISTLTISPPNAQAKPGCLPGPALYWARVPSQTVSRHFGLMKR